MNMKSLLLCLGLCSTLSVGSASGATLAREGNQLAKPDTLITLTEDELVAGLRAIAEAYRAKAAPRKQGELTAEHLRILKFQMLLNALGLGALPPQAQPLQPQQAPQPRVYNPSLQPTYSLPQQIYSLPERHIYSQPQPYPVYPQTPDWIVWSKCSFSYYSNARTSLVSLRCSLLATHRQRR